MIPKVLKDFNLIVDGRGLLGIAEEIVLPKLVMQAVEHQAAGMLGPIQLDMGLEALEMEFTLADYQDEILRMWGVKDASGIGARFMGAMVAGDGGQTSAVEIAVRGRWQEIDLGTVKKKDQAKQKVKMPLTNYRYTVDGEVIADIDMIGGKMVINGEDLTADVRAAIGQQV